MNYLRQKKNTIFHTLLGSLTLIVIRNIYKKITGIETIPQDKNNKESIQKLIEFCGVPREEILELLFEAEIEKPFRHLFLSRWTGEFKNIIAGTNNIKNIEINVSNYIGISNLICDYVKIEPNSIAFTFSHDVTCTHWYWKDGGHYPESVTIRHPIIIHFHKNNSVLVTYPGFTFERGNTQNFEYSDLVNMILVELQKRFSIEYKPYLIKKVVETLLQRKSTRVNFIRIKSGNDDGALDFQSKSNDLSIENLLPSLMIPYLPKVITEEQIKTALINAIKDCDLRSSILYWREEEIATKLSYYSMGMEFLVTWTRQEQSFEIISPILEFLIFLSLKYENENSNIFEFFINSKQPKIYTKSDIASAISVGSKELDRELVGLVSQRVIETRYRLKTEKLVLDYENKWVPSLQELRKHFELEDHGVIDGTIPENIEVGFIFSESARESSFGS